MFSLGWGLKGGNTYYKNKNMSVGIVFKDILNK